MTNQDILNPDGTVFASPPVDGRLGRYSAWAAAALALLCGFLLYPGFLFFTPGWNVQVFEPALPGFFLAALIFVRGDRLIALCRDCRAYPAYPVLVFFLLVLTLWHAGGNPSNAQPEFGRSLLFLAGPVAGAVYARELLKLAPYFLAFVWVSNLWLSMMQTSVWGMLPFGVTGNINWTASLGILTAPFAIWVALRLSRGRRALAWPLITGICAFTGWLLWLASSRGAFVSLVLTGFLWLVVTVPSRVRKRLIWGGLTGLFVLVGFLLYWGETGVVRVLSGDERFVLAAGAVDLISARPVFGYGISEYENAFLGVRDETYFSLKHSAPRTEHPHNHVLYMGAGLGLVGLAAWLVLLIAPLIVFLRRGPSSRPCLLQVVFYGFVFLLFHSLLDLVLFYPPTATVGYLFLGILWADACSGGVSESPRAVFGDGQRGRVLRLTTVGISSAIAAVLCGFCWWEAFLNLRAGLHVRAGDKMMWEAEACLTAGRDKEAWLLAEKAGKEYSAVLDLPHHNYDLLYRAMMFFAADPGLKEEELLRGALRLKSSALPDYGHVNSCIGHVRMQRGDFSGAGPFLLREAELYPIQFLPLVKLMQYADRVGDHVLVERLNERILALCRKNDLTLEDVRFICENPEWDDHHGLARAAREKAERNRKTSVGP